MELQLQWLMSIGTESSENKFFFFLFSSDRSMFENHNQSLNFGRVH